MTRQDFKWFVEFIVIHDLPHAARHDLMSYFAKKNPRFDYAIFNRELNKFEESWKEATYG